VSAVVRNAVGRFASTRPAGVDVHDYARYSQGCRCETCKAAKADYIRTRRAAAAGLRRQAVAAGQVYVAAGITHGASGYRDASCRCPVCCRAKKASQVRLGRRAEMALAS
jgi:rubredoxin